MTPRVLLLQTARRLREAGIPDPVEDAALLLSHLLGRPPLALRVDDETQLDESLLSAYQHLVGKRLTREPLQYLLKESVFYGRSFFVDPRVLIPRPETEWLCAWALETLAPVVRPSILDLCTGSGCIGLTLKAERPDATLILSDLSEDGLQVASHNADRLGLSVTFCRSDLFAAVSPAPYHCIISNPPYIPSSECGALQPEVLFEPPLALDGGSDGLSLYRRLILDAPRFLCDGGFLFLELGMGEAAAVAALLRLSGFEDIQIRQDLAGIDRMIRAQYVRRKHV